MEETKMIDLHRNIFLSKFVFVIKYICLGFLENHYEYLNILNVKIV